MYHHNDYDLPSIIGLNVFNTAVELPSSLESQIQLASTPSTSTRIILYLKFASIMYIQYYKQISGALRAQFLLDHAIFVIMHTTVQMRAHGPGWKFTTQYYLHNHA